VIAPWLTLWASPNAAHGATFHFPLPAMRWRRSARGLPRRRRLIRPQPPPEVDHLRRVHCRGFPQRARRPHRHLDSASSQSHTRRAVVTPQNFGFPYPSWSTFSWRGDEPTPGWNLR